MERLDVSRVSFRPLHPPPAPAAPIEVERGRSGTGAKLVISFYSSGIWQSVCSSGVRKYSQTGQCRRELQGVAGSCRELQGVR